MLNKLSFRFNKLQMGCYGFCHSSTCEIKLHCMFQISIFNNGEKTGIHSHNRLNACKFNTTNIIICIKLRVKVT